MKIFAIVAPDGEVVATARETPSAGADSPFGGRLVPPAGCKVHEITLPPGLHHVRSAKELHREVAKLIRSGQARPSTD